MESGNEQEAGLLFAAVRRGQFVILAEKEDSVTAALLHLVQCGGSTSGSSNPSGKSGAGDWRGLWRRSCCGGRMKPGAWLPMKVLVADAGVRSLIAEEPDTAAGYVRRSREGAWQSADG